MIELVDVRKKLGNRFITNGVTLSIPKGKMTVLIGRSGEGKSVLLKQVIGLLKPTSGRIIVDGITVTDKNVDLAQLFAKCGYVFQFAALLDSLTVYENIGIKLLESGQDETDVRDLIIEKLPLVSLNPEILDKHPNEVSGGTRKRIGLLRTLLSNPEIIFYDEPTTGLDPITARVIHELIFDMQKKLSITSVIISHDIEIFKYADYVALLHEGTIKYFGSAKTIWECDNPYVFQFIRGLSEGPIGNV